ncbi:MAG: amidohydrolase family protein [Cryomorphaceae bacterium]|nr:amidohydrolase family protein [Cryomorphaceae bacterium]
MKHVFNFLLCCIPMATLLAQTQPVNGTAPSLKPKIALTHASVLQSDGTVLENSTLLLEGETILECGKSVVIPKGAIAYDMTGMTIVPGFIELNSSIGLPKPESTGGWSPRPQIESKKEGAFYWNESIHPETDAALLYKSEEKTTDELRKMGFTVALSHVPDGIARGTGVLVALRDDDENKVVLQSSSAQFFSFEKGVSRQTYPSSQMGSIALLRQVFYDLQWYTKATKKETDLSLEAMQKNAAYPMFFKTSDKWEILRAEKVANEFGLAFHYLGSGNEYEILKQLKLTGKTVIAPLNFPDAYDVKDPYLSRHIPLSDLKHWELAPSNPYFLEKEGIPFCLSSQGLKSPESFWKNIRKALQRGATKAGLLQALTTHPAKLIGMAEKLGSLESGKLANFNIYSGDPFTEDAKLYESWILGERKVFQKPLQEDISGKYNVFLTDKKYPLELSRTNDAWSAKITSYRSPKANGSSGQDTLIVKSSVSLTGNDLVLQFNLDDNNWKGSVTLHAKANAKLGILEGDGLLPDGNWIQWSAIRNDKAEVTSKTESKAASDELSEKMIWHPNMAFGFDSIPLKKSVLFKNATVWTNESEGILYGANVLVENGKIAFVGISVPKTDEKTQVIDAKGMHLTSGIIDEHSHIAISRGVNEGGQAITAEVSIADVVNPDDINIYRQLSGGVTAAQLLHGSANPIGGQSALIKLKWGTDPEEMLIDNAPKFIKCALGENVKQANWGDYNTDRFPQTRMGVEQVFYDGFARARAYAKAWEDFQKQKGKHQKIAPRKDLELEVLNEILRSERFITCHSYVQSEINMLMHVADSMGFKINTFTHILEGYKVADKMLKHGVGASTFSDWWAYKFEVNDAIPYNASLMTKMGLTVAINSDDAEMGRRLNQEAAKGIKYGGMSEEEAWKMVTLNPAKLLHLDHQMGSIKVGKDVDVVLWTDNPLSINAQTSLTMIEGTVYFDRSREAQLEVANQKEKARIISKMLDSNSKGEESQPFQKQKNKQYQCDTLGEEATSEENTH